jgi:hypothetical protein
MHLTRTPLSGRRLVVVLEQLLGLNQGGNSASNAETFIEVDVGSAWVTINVKSVRFLKCAPESTKMRTTDEWITNRQPVGS